MTPIIVGYATCLLAAISLAAAWRYKLAKRSKALPSWRNAIGIAALLLLSTHWIAIAVLEVPIVFGVHRPEVFEGVLLSLSHPLDACAAVLSLALSGGARNAALAGAILLLIGWPVGYV
jgi:hypothetical protein